MQPAADNESERKGVLRRARLPAGVLRGDAARAGGDGARSGAGHRRLCSGVEHRHQRRRPAGTLRKGGHAHHADGLAAGSEDAGEDHGAQERRGWTCSGRRQIRVEAGPCRTWFREAVSPLRALVRAAAAREGRRVRRVRLRYRRASGARPVGLRRAELDPVLHRQAVAHGWHGLRPRGHRRPGRCGRGRDDDGDQGCKPRAGDIRRSGHGCDGCGGAALLQRDRRTHDRAGRSQIRWHLDFRSTVVRRVARGAGATGYRCERARS